MAGKPVLTRLTGNGNGSGSGSGECGGDDCPNVYATDRGSFVVQGDLFDGFTAPEGEGLVEIPEHILREAVRALGW
ncbi:hypothetical protein ACFV84_20640 [Kitasatospora sp. NPDC059811]|uniref:hypothetical protein n=1 Tax=Streptomycetaceae TaxID=2062 RepID=UPI0007AF2AD7|nr:hypothetical protein [Streptomyces sp. MJM8645]